MPISQLPVAAPLNSDSAGNGGPIANPSVFRIICPSTGSMGTGFAHQSGWVITAEHVVRGAQAQEIIILTSSNAQYRVLTVHFDASLDLAILQPVAMPAMPTLPLSSKTDFQIGTQISTWGYPMGYTGAGPMLTVGFLSGGESVNGVGRWVINAAFNSGNSGGPVLHLEDASVLGVVSSKLAPLPDHINSILQALAQQTSGFMYTVTKPDGTTEHYSEGRLIAEVLQFLRSQTQLVVGHAVPLPDLKGFLTRHSIQP